MLFHYDCEWLEELRKRGLEMKKAVSVMPINDVFAAAVKNVVRVANIFKPDTCEQLRMADITRWISASRLS